MGWTLSGTAWQDYDWQDEDLIQDLWKAYNERRQALGQSPATLPAAGDDFQHINIYKTIQDWIASNYDDFVRSHTAYGTPRATDYYDGEATIEMWTFADLCTAAGLTGGDFRRATAKPTDWTSFSDAAYSAGRHAAGYIIGPWLPFDLQRMLNMLIWTKKTALWNWSVVADGNNVRQGSVDNYSPHTWDESKTECDSRYTASSTGSNNVPPEAWTEGKYYSDTMWHARVERRLSKLQVTGVPTFCTRTIDFCVKATADRLASYPDVWDNCGDDVNEEAWSIFDTITGTSGTVRSDTIGNINDPHLCTWCEPPTAGTIWKSRGYEVEDECVIVRWNVTNGFAYVAP